MEINKRMSAIFNNFHTAEDGLQRRADEGRRQETEISGGSGQENEARRRKVRELSTVFALENMP